MNEAEKERLIKEDIVSIENRVRHAFNQGYEMGLKENKSEIPTGCGDAISRADARHLIAETNRNALGYISTKVFKILYDGIDNLPSVTPQPKMGRWVPLEYDGYADGNPVWDKWECRECGWEHTGDEESLTAFCPNCGTKMEEIEE